MLGCPVDVFGDGNIKSRMCHDTIVWYVSGYHVCVMILLFCCCYQVDRTDRKSGQPDLSSG